MARHELGSTAAGVAPELTAWAAVATAWGNEIFDLFLERRSERVWLLRQGRVVEVATATLEGGACRRRDGRLFSTDGLERSVIAGLLGLPARQLPPTALPAAPVLPAWEDLGFAPDAALTRVRWLWRAGFHVSAAGAFHIRRPILLDLQWGDGRRAVRPWPWASEWSLPPPLPARPASPPTGAVRALFAPQAAGTLLHELFGHPLEADRLRAGRSPWAGHLGQRVSPLSLDVWDDPTRWDLPGAYDRDDEGLLATVHPLVANGVLVGGLGDLTTHGFGGNARRASLHLPPRPRISNLVARVRGALAEPPRHEANLEILAVAAATLVDRAKLLVVQVRCAHTLHHGRPGRALGEFSLVGPAARVAAGLQAAGGEPQATAEPGWCGKEGELIPTGSEAPWLLVDGLEVR